MVISVRPQPVLQYKGRDSAFVEPQRVIVPFMSGQCTVAATGTDHDGCAGCHCGVRNIWSDGGNVLIFPRFVECAWCAVRPTNDRLLDPRQCRHENYVAGLYLWSLHANSSSSPQRHCCRRPQLSQPTNQDVTRKYFTFVAAECMRTTDDLGGSKLLRSYPMFVGVCQLSIMRRRCKLVRTFARLQRVHKGLFNTLPCEHFISSSISS